MSEGAQAELATRPWHHLDAYGWARYLHTVAGNTIEVDGYYLATRGKQEVGSPKLVGAIGLSFDNGTWFGNVNLHDTDPRTRP